MTRLLSKVRSLQRQKERIEKERREKIERRSQSKGKSNLDHLTFREFCSKCEGRTGRGITPINIYDWQEQLAELMFRRKRIVCAKSRQTGLSTFALLFVGYVLECVHPGLVGLFVAKTGADALNMGRKFRKLMSALNILENDAMSHAIFKNGSEFHFRSCTPEEGVGRSLDAVQIAVLDETAFWENSDPALVMEALQPIFSAVGDSAMLLQLSTPNGNSGYYYDSIIKHVTPELFNGIVRAIKDEGDEPFQCHGMDSDEGYGLAIINWRAVPQYLAEQDFLGRIKRQFSLTDSAIAREYELEFSEPAEALFPFSLLISSTEPLPEFPENEKGGIVRYMGVDPSSASANDYFVILVLRQFEGVFYVEQIERSRTATMEVMMIKANDMIKKLNPIEIQVEKNGVGEFPSQQLQSASFGNRVTGHNTTRHSKDSMISRCIYILESGLLKLPEGSVLVKELANFRRFDDGSCGVPESIGNDDTVMALFHAISAAQIASVQNVA